MKTKSPSLVALVCLMSCAIAVPGDLWATPAPADQRAGEISRVIPAVSIARGSKIHQRFGQNRRGLAGCSQYAGECTRQGLSR